MPNEIELFSPEEMQSPFDAIKETDAEGREWWNSRHLARLMGYQKYWNFERLVDKVASFLQQEKGADLGGTYCRDRRIGATEQWWLATSQVL